MYKKWHKLKNGQDPKMVIYAKLEIYPKDFSVGNLLVEEDFMRNFQTPLPTMIFRMHGRYHPSLAHELNQSDPHSAASTPRSNRIAKELASMYHALPLGSSGSIFICLDEERCDVLKVSC